ncbi:MAG: methyl-accepting chemotaxis protein [Spirochaetota bacterium]
MKIKHKLTNSVLVIILGFILSTLVQFEMQQRINQVYQLKSISTATLSRWNRLNSVTKGFLISQRPVGELQQEYAQAFAEFKDTLAKLVDYIGSEQVDGEIELKINALSDLWDMYEVNFQIIDETTTSISAGRLKEEIGIQGVLSFFLRSIHSNSLSQQEYQLLQNIDSNISSIEAAAAKFQTAIFKLNIQLDRQAEEILQRSRYYTLGISSIVILFALIFATTVSFRISRRVQHVEATMRSAAKRNIAVRYAGRARDEIGSLGRNLNTVLETMQEFFGTSHTVAHSLESLKEQLSRQSADSVSEMEAITSHLATISADFNRLDNTVNSAKEESRQIAAVVETAQASIQDQSNPLNTISSALAHMNKAIQEVADLTEHFGSSSQSLLDKTKAGSGNVLHTQRMISQVTKEIENLVHVNEVIEGITEQTHLLSINASIESANAGEAGKSFGVVAHEIKKLAETTAAHSHRIEETLQHITELIRSADEQSKRSADSFDAIQAQVHSNVDLFKNLQSKTGELQTSGHDIVISNREVEKLTSKLTQEYATIQELSASIQNAMNTASDSSGEGVLQISSIKSSVEQVEASLQRMAAALEESHHKTRQLIALLGSFQT